MLRREEKRPLRTGKGREFSLTKRGEGEASDPLTGGRGGGKKSLSLPLYAYCVGKGKREGKEEGGVLELSTLREGKKKKVRMPCFLLLHGPREGGKKEKGKSAV